MTKSFDRFYDARINAVLIRHVYLHGSRNPRTVNIDVSYGSMRALGHKGFGKIKTDATCNSRNKGGISGELHHEIRKPWASNRWISAARGFR